MTDNERTGKSLFVYTLSKSLLLSLVLTGAFLLVLAAAYLIGDIKDSAARALVTASSVLSVFVSSVIGGRKLRKHGLVLGIAAALLYAIVLYITGFMAFGFPGFSKGVLPTAALLSLGGALGGIIGVNIRLGK